VVKEVNLTLVPQAEVGDYVMVHVGAAIAIVNEQEAAKTFEILRQLGELDELETGGA
jgi:hydrogenase expression/formation protein HypC